MEDYSSYESVDEEEAPPAKGRAKGGKKALKPEPSEITIPVAEKPKEAKKETKPKGRAGGVAKQKSLMTFFGPASAKK